MRWLLGGLPLVMFAARETSPRTAGPFAMIVIVGIAFLGGLFLLAPGIFSDEIGSTSG